MQTQAGEKFYRIPIAGSAASFQSTSSLPPARKAQTQMSDPVDVIVDAFHQLASYHPGSATEVERVLARQPEMFAEIGKAYNDWANSLTDGQPFEQHLGDAVREIGIAVSATGGVAQSAHQTMRTVHAADFARIEEPRNDEGMWNPERQA